MNDEPDQPDQNQGSAGLRLIVAMPALNEAMTVREMISRVPQRIVGVGSIEVVIVDDGSHDETADIARRSGAHVISHHRQRGVGAAFQTALHYAIRQRADLLATLDSDGQFNPEDLNQLIAPIVEDDADFVTASRFVDPAMVPEMPGVKRWGNKKMSQLVSRLSGQKYHDVSCGMRCYNRLAMLNLNPIGSFTYTQEVFLNLAFKHLRIVEVPLAIRGEREFGESRVASSIVRYAVNTSTIIWRSYRDYKPWQFFGALSAMAIIPSILLALFLVTYYLMTGKFSPHKWAGFTSAALLLFGLLMFYAGMFGDMLVRHRIYLEELLVHARERSPVGANIAKRIRSRPTEYDESGRRKKMLVFGAPLIEEEEIREVTDSLRSGWIGTGPKVARFENQFGQFKGGQEHCIAVSSCTAAMHLSLLCMDFEEGDEVITTAMTFCATVNAILHAGATPVLADVDPETMNIDPASLESKVTPRTRAIIPVHFAGRPCDMDAIMRIAETHGLRVIEDCAHAVESEYNGRHTGTIGDFGCFSFYATKNVTTAEGGMVICKNEEDAMRLKRLSLHGMSQDAWRRFSDVGYKHYLVNELGFKCNMTDLEASIGLHQLARVNVSWQRRKEIWERYQSEFADLPITLPFEPSADMKHGLHLYTILVDPHRAGMSRDALLERLQAENIGVGVHYLSIAEHPFYQGFGWKPEHCPNAMKIGRETISLPLSAAMSSGDVGDVITAMRRVLADT